MERLRQLIHEIHRRSLWQVLGIYVFGGWVVLQVADLLTEAAALPEWFPALALGLLVIGLPVVMATAFVQEGTPRPGPERADVTRTETPDPLQAHTTGASRLFNWRYALAGGVGALVVWGVLAAGWLILGERPSAAVGDQITTAGRTVGTLVNGRPSVAVLPLENLSGDPEDEAFTAGMHDEIQGRLSKIGGLRVIAREAVMRYQGTTRPLQEIAEELKVGSLVTGTVRRAAGRVRTSVQLVDPATGENLWTEDYDRELSPEQIFDIWTEIAGEIAQALNTELTSEEQVRVAARPTDSEEAYQYFLLGKSIWYEGGRQAAAAEMFEQATEVDPTFLDAWGFLSRTDTELWWGGSDRSEERRASAEEALRRAGELDPTHPEYLCALGDYAYYVLEDYEQSRRAYERAIQADPNLSWVWMGLGYTRRRLGDFEGAIEAFSRAEALELDPLITRQIVTTFGVLRSWEEASAAEARLRILNPGNLGAWLDRGTVLYRQGAVTEARADIERVIEAGNSSIRVPAYLALTYIAERRFDEALSLLESPDHQDFVSDEAMHSRDLEIATVLDFAGRSREARESYQAAREWLETQLAQEPEHAGGHANLGLALAGLGEKEAAVSAGRRAVELQPLDHDAFAGTLVLDRLAAIYAKVGEVGAATTLIEDLLERPSFLTIPRLRMEPDWDPLRQDPRFQALLARGG